MRYTPQQFDNPLTLEQVEEMTKNFVNFTWGPMEVDGLTEEGTRPMYFTYENIVMFVHYDNSLMVSIHGREMFNLNVIGSAGGNKQFVETFEQIRLKTATELDKEWNSGFLAEEYIVLAFRRKILIHDLVKSSPLVFKIFDTTNLIINNTSNFSDIPPNNFGIKVKYQKYPKDMLLKIARMTDNEDIFDGLLTLPLDALNAL